MSKHEYIKYIFQFLIDMIAGFCGAFVSLGWLAGQRKKGETKKQYYKKTVFLFLGGSLCSMYLAPFLMIWLEYENMHIKSFFGFIAGALGMAILGLFFNSRIAIVKAIIKKFL